MEFNPDRYAKLIYRNRSSTDFGIMINAPWEPVHPTSDATNTHVLGRDGDIWQDNGSFNNVTQTFTCTVIRNPELYANWWEFQDAINDWLQIGSGYSYLELSAYPDWVFYAQAEPFTLSHEGNNTDMHGTLTLTFNCAPYATALRGLDWKKCKETMTIINPTDIPIHPEWHIKGKGDVQVTVNDEIYYFDDVDGDLFLNSDGNAWYTNSDGVKVLANAQVRLVNNDSPEFLTGKNTISFGKVTTETINPESDASTTTDTAGFEVWYKAKWKKVI